MDTLCRDSVGITCVEKGSKLGAHSLSFTSSTLAKNNNYALSQLILSSGYIYTGPLCACAGRTQQHAAYAVIGASTSYNQGSASESAKVTTSDILSEG